MILIADSGSTKTHWAVVSEKKRIQELITSGLNPFYQTHKEISIVIKKELLPKLCITPDFESLFFYGAGCIFSDNLETVKMGLETHIDCNNIEVNSDLLAAARACLGNQEGIACILGTGSNSCHYDGYKIVQHVSPLGYILGDEGSGAILGRNLLGDVLKKQLSKDLTDAFHKKYPISQNEIQHHVYKMPFPNRYMARFCDFLYENITHPMLKNKVYDEFVRFFDRNIRQYNVNSQRIAFVGSIAFYFEEILHRVALEYNFSEVQILKEPLKNLIAYHVEDY